METCFFWFLFSCSFQKYITLAWNKTIAQIYISHCTIEAFGRNLQLKWYFRNESSEFQLHKFQPKYTGNHRKEDAAIEIYLSSLEEKLIKMEIQRDKFNNLSKGETDALYICS